MSCQCIVGPKSELFRYSTDSESPMNVLSSSLDEFSCSEYQMTLGYENVINFRSISIYYVLTTQCHLEQMSTLVT
ncbi:Hypothetical predicted protein [Octopus vulgaris]|uniref:Uncharacterized protein n=1 Tax=Octopus vulgaris TaxID=6645 RepID=A0AA36BQ95_OCTVU|nr:Hypothetical predicted protein [Octopus vulgaris]